MISDRHRRLFLAALVGGAACLVVLLATGAGDHALLYGLPFLLCLAPLVSGRYVGEEALERWLERPRRPLPARATRPPSRRLEWRARISGGALLAARLAGRAPPVAVAVT